MGNITLRTVNLKREKERKKIDEFLHKFELILEKDVEYTLALYDDERIIGTGSVSGNVLKCIAIDPDYQGEGMANKLVSDLMNYQYDRGRTHLFIFTKPMNKRIFEDMGFTEITRLDGVISLLENDPKGLANFLKKLKKKRQDGRIISSIVMNCNPFTLGHQYLIEYVSNNSDVVHVFVVWEDRSVFPNDVRYRLVKAGIKHLPNVIIHKGKDYIISNSTFPSYFIKEKNSIVKIHAQLDLKIFGEFIAPALGINRRYVGHEPIDPLTREYNAVMKNLLPQYGIEVFEINRLEYRGLAISASRIRQAIKDDNLDSIKEMVPKSTYEFLISEEAKPIIDKIKSL